MVKAKLERAVGVVGLQFSRCHLEQGGTAVANQTKVILGLVSEPVVDYHLHDDGRKTRVFSMQGLTLASLAFTWTLLVMMFGSATAHMPSSCMAARESWS